MSTRNKKGFTLIELLVTIAIIAILAAVGTVVYSSTQKSARISKRLQDLNALKTAVELYKSTTGQYPLQAGSFQCMRLVSGLAPAYMPTIPEDPLTGDTYCYQYYSEDGNNYKVRTSPNITSAEMTSNEFKQQPGLIDPEKDGTPDCNIDTTSTNITGWAVYSGSLGCAY
ncbi:MAG: hypothetical protein ACD_30C00014G0012 [uncultured bacterium]|uniref:Type II secretion system protein GspG C-terminal domain-containing protein n=3 Tax=Candidatus Daviesiibacteriota TaxID=1752718 RepID=A0A0G0F8L9_9BACT|nr:MAG: hypothetical protein ACD_30C00014G0012 [uncultured bacterium]KKQ09850.1 MAG: hypothetical protein US19_C0010G0031 [Candidatus Daviesbacteria bacterium GW2011_GWB1_36_5]OGE31495.1 MAG: hypothetical protein A3C99_03085 [Candidatus Daviesbacteria bacterium RIFCSPHIGHO2_02_FULL_37_9]OGE36340.1 MAG: hypothetical protein A3E66_05585 [Candidatus Daviesbacteria bacterium RIFCSPHIGHO2_12_FULL_37_16]